MEKLEMDGGTILVREHIQMNLDKQDENKEQ